MNAIEKIINYFEKNEEIFIEVIEDLDSYSGYLGDNRYYEMESLNELFNGCDNIDILNRAYFGHDADTWHTDSCGNREYGAFNPNRVYFTFNGYGNLISSDYKDYSAYLDKYFVEAVNEDIDNLYSVTECPELVELFKELQEGEENE